MSAYDLQDLPQPQFGESPLGFMQRIGARTDEELAEVALALATRLAREAQDADTPTCRGTGSSGSHKVFFMPWPAALVPGHIYSEAGRSEIFISGTCEYCFDYLFADTEE